MAKWAHADVLDGGLAYVKANAIKMLLLADYSAGDSYATVIANKVSETTVAPTDMIISSSGTSRILTVAAFPAVTAVAAALSGPAGLALTDGVSKVLLVTSANIDRDTAIGDSTPLPAWIDTMPQPV